jgi:hypothetical protein
MDRVKEKIPYFILPIGILFYEIVAIFVMHFVSYNTMIIHPTTIRQVIVRLVWFDGWTNIIAFIGLSFIFIFELPYLSLKQRYLRAIAVTLGMFILGFYADNIVPQYGYGQSGFDYVLTGIIMSIALFDLFTTFVKKDYLHVEILSAIIIILYGELIFFPSLFYTILPDVNFSVHVMSFKFGLILGVLLSAPYTFLTIKGKIPYRHHIYKEASE